MSSKEIIVKPIATIHSDFQTKFGIPRQSGLVPELVSEIVFESEYRDPEALRGIEEYSHLWLLWQFSGNNYTVFSPTVRPPRLGGNIRKGVFATRSPFRPNSIGLSCVKLLELVPTSDRGTVLRIAGADLMDGTPILDIKPYVAYADSHPDALGGFTDKIPLRHLEVLCAGDIKSVFPPEKWDALAGVLAADPRPAYQKDPDRVYGFGFAGYEIRFKVENETLTVVSITAEH